MTWPVRLRWLVAAAWALLAVWSAVQLPTIDRARTETLRTLAPTDADAIEAEIASKTRFGFPLLSRTLIVERDPNGLTIAQQAETVERAAALTRQRLSGYEDIVAALPVSNAFGPRSFAPERSTTALTYLFFRPDASLHRRAELSRRLADTISPRTSDGFVGVTGAAPAMIEQGNVIVDRLPLVELATLLLVMGAMALRFRAFGAPVLVLVTVAVAYLVSSHVVAAIGQKTGVAVPQEVEPVIVVLLFGIVTDYSIFYLSRMRALLGDGLGRIEAATRATAQVTPLITAAGLCIVAATATLLAAQLDFLRVFGPGMAFAVITGVAVSVTLVPALLGLFGRALFWPRTPDAANDGAAPVAETGAPSETETSALRKRESAGAIGSRNRLVRFADVHPWWSVGVASAVLALCSAGLLTLHLANPIVRGLPASSEPRLAYEQAARGFAPGILSPTVLVVSGRGVTAQRAALTRLQRSLAKERGVALVVGPANQPLDGMRFGATLSTKGNAARYFIVLSNDPLGAAAIDDLRRLRARIDVLASRAGLTRVQADFAGDTALSAETIDTTNEDLAAIMPLALIAIFIVVAVFLRAIVAPLYLVASSLLAFGAALGVAAVVFGEITYYVPFASAVLLVSLGSDYNVFLIGRIWQEAEERPLHEAIPVGATRAARAITVAGLVLAGSFALMGIVPIRAFGELAFVMSVGILLDTFVVRTLLVPALVKLVGPVSAWPGGRLDGPREGGS